MINEIHVENFKSFKNNSFRLNNLTLLSGENSGGKSSFIQIILMLKQSYKKNPKIDGLYLNGDYTFLGYSNDIFYEFYQGDIEAIDIEVKANGHSFNRTWKYVQERTILELMSDIKDSEKFDFSVFEKIEYISANRITPSSQFSLITDEETLGTEGENTMLFLETYGATIDVDEYLCMDDALSTKLIVQVNYWLNQLFPRFSLQTEKVNLVDLVNLSFQEQIGRETTNKRRPINVGFGVTYVIPIIVALLKSKEGDTVIIENPESHLHPSAQTKIGMLISLAAQNGAQVIVETHSDHVLNSIRLAIQKKIIHEEKVKIMYFTKEEVGDRDLKELFSKVDEPTIDSNGNLSHWPEGFFDEWEKTIENLLGGLE